VAAIGLEWGEQLPPGSVSVRLHGSAGQSFGAFLADGVSLELVGEARTTSARPGRRPHRRPPTADDAGDPVLAGNTVLYGATGGQLHVAGPGGGEVLRAQQRRHRGGRGSGDHACEYMTGGTVVILGPFGYNLGAGMTGGQAYVYDHEHLLSARMNRQLVDAALLDDAQAAELRFLVERHRELTGSPRARRDARGLGRDAALLLARRPARRGRAHRARQRRSARRGPVSRAAARRSVRTEQELGRAS